MANTPQPSDGKPERQNRLWAISDIHLAYKANQEAFEELSSYPNDDLIICGDVGESAEHCRIAFAIATKRFRRVIWAPGNHELYTLPKDPGKNLRGEAKYMECVEVARSFGVLTPEDEYVKWEGDGEPCLIAPIFTLYDYSFRPDHVELSKALDWAMEQDVVATDEFVLHPDPYASRIEWCHALVEKTEAKLVAAVAAHPGVKLIIVGHWPLREDLVKLPKIPRFSLWCGTKKTEQWHKKFNARAVISGHLHIPRTDWVDGTRFEEVSLGYPRQWQACKDRGLDINDLLREILPGPATPKDTKPPTLWRRYG